MAAFAEGGRMVGALREEFSGVQMDKISADQRGTKGTSPNIVEVTFLGPVGHGPLFTAIISELVKWQLGRTRTCTPIST